MPPTSCLHYKLRYFLQKICYQLLITLSIPSQFDRQLLPICSSLHINRLIINSLFTLQLLILLLMLLFEYFSQLFLWRIWSLPIQVFAFSIALILCVIAFNHVLELFTLLDQFKHFDPVVFNKADAGAFVIFHVDFRFLFEFLVVFIAVFVFLDQKYGAHHL